jgi:predicted MFS family arabinose efflux permease
MMTNNLSAKRWYVVSLGAAINMIAFAMGTACMPVLFKEISGKLGLDIVQIGTVWGLSSVAGIFSILTAGSLADRFGAKRVLTVICLLAGVFGALRGFSSSFAGLAITSLLFGLAAEAVPVIVIKNASLWFQDKGLGTAQGIITACVGAGMMLGAMFSATFLSPLFGGWERVTFFYGGISILAAVLWFLTIPEPPKIESLKRAAIPSTRQTLSHVFRSRGVWLIAIAMMGFAGCNKGVMGYLPVYLRDIGWSATAADGTLAALNAAGMVAAIPLTILSDKLGLRKAVLLPGVFIIAVSTGLFPIASGPAIWVLAVLSGLFRDLVWAMAATLTVETDGIGPVYAGTAVGIVHSFTRIGYTFAPPAGNSFAPLDIGLPFVFWAGLAVLALVFFFFVKETGQKKKRNYAVGDSSA